ncbi:aldehyde dehydrogenase [Trametes gibbosa]|nr:aldehyde dehydrogenase [Trametes gibbosa]
MPATTCTYSTFTEIDEAHARLSKTFREGRTLPLAYRRRQLFQLARMLQENHVAIENALFADLNKPRHEAAVAEIGNVISSALDAANNLERWAAPEPCPTEEWCAGWKAKIHKAPKGVALIIAPWNYPIVLTMHPFVGAIAAGCPTVIKPSELVPAVSQLLAELFPRYLDPEGFAVVKGGIPETTHVLSLRWAHILYTGNGNVGRIIAAAAAKHLTPVTLELGGKSPAVVADDADLDIAARRILHGKIQNAGQLCVTPDYAIVSRARADALVESFKKARDEFWPAGDCPLTGKVPVSNIINDRHLTRLVDLLERTKGEIVFGGRVHDGVRLAPTVLTNVPEDDALMEEEIFGPILPIVVVDDMDHAIRFINSKDFPLVIYLFTNQDELENKFLLETQSGQLILNDVIMQLAVRELPFGGLGESGCTSNSTFDTFTHVRGSVNIPFEHEPLFQQRYRPYTEDKYHFVSAPYRIKIPEA